MLLNLREIRTAHERYERTYSPEAFAGDDEGLKVVAPVVLGFDIFKDNAQFRLVGRVQTALELRCDRCLEPFTWPLDAAFDLWYRPHRDNVGEGEREIEEDDLSTSFYEHEAIDLGQLMREQCYLALPMKPLCRETCRGLCPMCGTDLNQDACGCRPEWEDPRLASLKALKNRHS